MSSKKKYNEQLKNEEEIERKKIINIVIGTIASIIALIMLLIPKIRKFIYNNTKYFANKLWTFLTSIKWSENFKALFNGTNRFTTGMSIFTMAFIGVFAIIGHLLLILSLKYADASKLAPFGYFEIITNIIIGYYFFNNFPDYWTFIGLFIIVSSGVYIFRREVLIKSHLRIK